jgi:hypothetical protein
MQRTITDFVGKHKGMEVLLRPFISHLQARRARSLRAFLKSADELFGFWPPGRARANGESVPARDAA